LPPPSEPRGGAICGYRLLEGSHPLRGQRDLQWHILIHRFSKRYLHRSAWIRWFRAAGFHKIYQNGAFDVRFDDFAIQVAVEGQGVAFASNMLMEDELQTGRLVAPFEIKLRTNYDNYLVSARLKVKDSRVAPVIPQNLDSRRKREL
jgi:LysR family glycine cleavage system transcriptional activator